MLMEPSEAVAAYVPPPVNALSEAECERVRSRLAGAVDGWDGAFETGLRLECLRLIEEVEGLRVIEGEIEYAAVDVGISLSLPSVVCSALICVSLGAPVDDAERPLTEVDLAILDLWAHKALRGVAVAMGTQTPGIVARRGGAMRRLFEEGAVVAGELGCPGVCGEDQSAGLLGMEREMVLKSGGTAGPTLAETPEVLLGGIVRLEAMIAGPSLSIRELVGMEEGDVLLLGPKDETEAALPLHGRKLAVGRPGAQSGRRAVRLRAQPSMRQSNR